MKKRNIIPVLALTLAIGMGATAYATSADNTATSTPWKSLGLGKITSMRGYDYITNILKSKLGLTDTEITNARNLGKTPYELATEKGLTQDELKKSLLEERTKAIEDAIAKGTITKEYGENLKVNLNTNMQNCTGNFDQKQGQGQKQGKGQSCGKMGNGQGNGCLLAPGN